MGSTVTWYSDIKSAWSDFVEENMGIIFNRINSLKKGIAYNLKETARVFEINNKEDYLKLVDLYPKEVPLLTHDGKKFIGIDFVEFQKYYDVLHLTETGYWETRDDIRTGNIRSTGLYSWDCESYLIMNLGCIDLTSCRVIKNRKMEEEENAR